MFADRALRHVALRRRSEAASPGGLLGREGSGVPSTLQEASGEGFAP
jgi:hypothetical protein